MFSNFILSKFNIMIGSVQDSVILILKYLFEISYLIIPIH